MRRGRDSGGRFAPGNPGGPGRPPRQKEREYLDSIMAECDLSSWREVVRIAVSDAKAGDHRAREWLGGYLIGKADRTILELHYPAEPEPEKTPEELEDEIAKLLGMPKDWRTREKRKKKKKQVAKLTEVTSEGSGQGPIKLI